MVLNQTEIFSWLGRFLWPFLRITGLFLTAPLYNSAFIPRSIKLVVSASYAGALAAWLPNLPSFPDDPSSIVLQAGLQLGVGAVIGMTMQIIVSAIACAGELVGLSIGLGFAELQFREASSATPVLFDLMFWFGLMGFIAVGGPEVLFAAVAHSFQAGISVGVFANAVDIGLLGSTLITSAVWLAMPVLAVSLCINIIVGLATVFAPQMNLLTIGFPLLILAGLWVFAASSLYLHRDIRDLFGTAMHSVSAILAHV